MLLRCLIWEGPRGGGGDVGFVGGLALGGGQGEGLVAEGLDLPLDGGGVERGVLLGQSTLGQGLDLGVGGDPGVRGLGVPPRPGHHRGPHPRAGRAGHGPGCPASSRWQVFGLGEVGDLRVGVAEVDLDRAVPGQVLVGSDGVVLDPVVLDVDGQVDRVGDLLEEQALVLQGPEAAFE